MVRGFKCERKNPEIIFDHNFYRWLSPNKDTRIFLGKRKDNGKLAAREVCKRTKKA
jgi:hypothetical protein